MVTQGEYVVPGAEDRIPGHRVKTDRGGFKGAKKRQPEMQEESQKSGVRS